MVASVAMNGGTRMAMMTKALSAPMAMPASTPPGSPAWMPQGLR